VGFDIEMVMDMGLQGVDNKHGVLVGNLETGIWEFPFMFHILMRSYSFLVHDQSIWMFWRLSY
jgi:hypothetical protein